MRGKRLTGRSVTGLLIAAMVSVGLLPVAASAAEATDLARGKPVVASGSHGGYPAANANDGDVNSYWESNGLPADLTVKLGADVDLESVVVKLDPDPIWASRTQDIQVLGRTQDGTAFTSLRARATYAFNPGGNQNTVTIPVDGRVADLQLRFFSNTEAPGAQIAEIQVLGTAAPNPDLTVSALSWSPSSQSETDDITVEGTVRNAGSAASPTTTVNVSLDGVVVGSAPVGPLAAGGSAPVAVEAGKRPQGSYTVSALVDPTDTVAESDNANNSRTTASPLVVGQIPGPDLEVRSISASPADPAVGAVVTFTVAVHNRGTSAVSAGTVTRLTVGSTTLNGTTPAIAAGGTANVAVDGSWTAASGGATLTATADATDLVAETGETNNTFARSIVVGRGAAVPYTELEAEDADYEGTLLRSDAVRTFGHTNYETESSGRESVRLDSTGEFVEFTSTAPSNSVVVRNSIPDAPGGGGREATISLYTDGEFVRKLDLSSKHSWLYGNTDSPEGLTNTPGGDARRLFDESHALLTRTYPAGTKFRLQRDASDNASFYVIDLIDLEQVAAPSSTTGSTTRTRSSAR